MFLGVLNKRSAAAPVAVLAALALTTTACGDEEEPKPATAPAIIDEDGGSTVPGNDGESSPADEPAADPETDRTAVEATLKRVLTTSDPEEACGEFVTERFVRRAFGDEAGCRAAQSQRAAADRVSVSEVVVTPESTAQAVVRTRGGVYDGERLRAELVLDAGLWRLDTLRSNVPVGP